MSKRLLDCLDHYTRGQSQTGHFSARALHYNALELKGLVQEVRETSDEKSGLQEFYETLERIVNELKGMTEHSIAFLQRVRKSDAPNYFDIIKNPMDLSTLLKKVRQREYKDKKAFTDDLNLIWDNCFEYNTWAEHPLRRSASILRNRGNHLLQFVNDVPPKPSAPPTSSGMPGFRYSRPSSFRADSTVPPSEADADGSVVDMPAPANDQLPLASKPFSRLEMFRNTLPLSPAHSRSATPFDRTVREESGEKPQKPSEPTEELLLLQQEELADYRATLVDPAKAELPNIPVPVASSSKHAIAEAQGQSFVEFAPLPDSLCQAIYDSVRLCSKVRKLNRAALQAHPSFEQPMPIIINGDSSSEEEDDDPTDDDEAILKGVLPLQFGTATLYNTQAASTVARRDLSSSISLLLANAGFQGVHKGAMCALADLAAQYVCNLGKTAQFFLERHGSRMTLAEVLGQTLAENGLPRPDQLRNHLAQAREHQTRLERMQTRLEKMCETLEGVDAGDPHSGLPEYLQSPAMFAEDDGGETGDASTSAPRRPFLFESPQPFVPLSSEGSSPDESISCQIRLLQPIFNQRAASEYGIVEDAELAPKLKKARRPKVPASGKVTLKRRTAANVTGSNKKLKAAS